MNQPIKIISKPPPEMTELAGPYRLPGEGAVMMAVVADAVKARKSVAFVGSEIEVTVYSTGFVTYSDRVKKAVKTARGGIRPCKAKRKKEVAV